MAKDTFWFKHDYNARNDEKILELTSIYGAEAYGIYWMIVETMAENDNGGVKATLMGGLSHGYGVAKGRLKEIIDSCLAVDLFYEKDGFYYSRRMLRHKEERKLLSEKGKEGAQKKWGGYRGANGVAYAEKNREEKKREYALFFKNGFAYFPDDTSQPLNEEQLILLEDKKLKPTDVQKS